MYRIAFLTFGLLREKFDHPAMQGFFDRNARAFEQAERSVGFIARSGYEDEPGLRSWGVQKYPRFITAGVETDWAPATLSLWEDLESIVAYAYAGIHGEALSMRRDWFQKPDWPTYAAWWVAKDDLPDWTEAVERLEYLHDHGPSAYAFSFSQPFGPDGSPTQIDRTKVQAKIRKNTGSQSI